MSLRSLLLAAAFCLAAGCTGPADGPQPGSTAPGQACSQATDCGCWQCACEGVGGAPGAAELCVAGVCPTGEAACTPVCALVGAGLAAATSVSECEGRP